MIQFIRREKGKTMEERALTPLLEKIRREFFYQVRLKGDGHPDVMESSGRYSDALRHEADTTKSDAERDLWIQYQLSVTYLKALLLQDAIQAIKDGLEVTFNEWEYRRNPYAIRYARRFKHLVLTLRRCVKQRR